MNWSHPAFEELTRRLAERTGLAFTATRRAWAEEGIRRAMTRTGMEDPSAFLRHVEDHPVSPAMDDLIAEMTVGETYFFREPAQFQFLRETVLPEIRVRKGDGHRLRAWSAGCASGEEAYSLAIVLREEWPPGQTHLLATDISRVALAKMAEASYPDWSLRGEGASVARLYLHRQGRRSEVVEPIRRLVEPKCLNLMTDDYPSPASGAWEMDLIFCRNVLIYLDRGAIRTVARRLHDSLAEGGWLIAASSDPPLADSAPFETVATEWGVFYRRSVTSHMGGDGSSLAHVAARQAQDSGEAMAEARDALARGDYALAVKRTLGRTEVDALILHVRAQSNLDLRVAERASAEAIDLHPLCSELRHLRALLLLSLGRDDEAARQARHAIYLDRTLAMAHFTLGSILIRLGDRPGAWRSYRNARDLLAARPADEPVVLSDGETAGRLARAAESQMARLDVQVGRER